MEWPLRCRVCRWPGYATERYKASFPQADRTHRLHALRWDCPQRGGLRTLVYEISIADRDCHYQRGRDLDTAWRLGIEQVPVCALPKLSCALPRRWAVLAAVMFAICLSCASQAQSVIPSPPEGKLPTLTTARQAHSLTSKEAMRAFPVHLRGVITYFDPDFGTGHPAIFIHDASGSIFVKQTSKLTGTTLRRSTG